MKLEDVIDLEAQLALDAQVDGAALHARDRALYRAMPKPPQEAAPLLSGWLSALRERDGSPNLGERVIAGHRLLRYVLLVLGLLSGLGTGEALLHFEQGGAPINLGYYLGVAVFGQLGALLLVFLGLLLRRFAPDLPVLGDMTRLLRYVARHLESWLHRARGAAARGERRAGGEVAAAELTAAYHRVRARRSLYGGVERYLLLWHTQMFAMMFNIGLLLSLVRALLFSDLVFGWSTSISGLSVETVRQLCAWIALPFSWLLPQTVPSLELVQHTQYFRLDGRFAGAAPGTRGDASLVGQWWRFLVACTVCYGLLPRLLIASFCSIRVGQKLRGLPLDTPDLQRVLRRLTTPEFSTRSVDPTTQGAEPAAPVAAAPPQGSNMTSLVRYRDVPTAPEVLSDVLRRDLGLTVLSTYAAGGLSTQADTALCETLGATGQSVTLVVEAWEAPDRGLRDFLSQLRAALGPQVALRVALIGEATASGYGPPAPQDVRVYRDRLQLLADPYLIVDVLNPAPVARVRSLGGEA